MNPPWLLQELQTLREASLFRQRRVVRRVRPGYLEVDGREYLDFGSNDYLGLAADARLNEAVKHFADRHAFGAAASPLVTGYTQAHGDLEADLAAFEGTEAALLFPSGLAANLGILAAVLGPEDVVFCEKRNHASLVDGCRLSGAKLRVFSGHRLDSLEHHLAKAAACRRRWIVVDSVFSMDGDLAPLADLCDLAERFDALTYVDEAHATGVLGPTGRGLAELAGVEEKITLRIGTLSKAVGTVGGFVACSQPWRDWLVNRARTQIYSTALPGSCAAAAQAALRILQAEPERRQRVLQTAASFRARCSDLGWEIQAPHCGPSESAIVPVMVGSAAAALQLAEQLRAQGIWTPALRPPTVPKDTARVRLSFSAAHKPADVERLLDVLHTVSRGFACQSGSVQAD